MVVGLRQGEDVRIKAFGGVHEDTPFPVASITKVVTAGAATALLDLDAEAFEGATVRDLLRHTGGLGADGGALEDLGAGDDALAQLAARPQELERIAPPRTLWSYGNPGYWLVGRLVEEAAGTTFAAAAREQVLAPAGMGGAALEPWREDRGGSLARDEPDGSSSYFTYPRARVPSGGLRATVRDVLALTAACWPDGALGHLGLLAAHGADDAVPSPGGRRWAAGWECWTAADGTVVAGHAGVYGGYRTRLWSVPSRRAAVAVLATGGDAVEEEVLRRALDGVEALTGLVEPPLPVAPPSHPASAYDGLRFVRRGATYAVRADGDELVLDHSDLGRLRAVPTGPDRFHVPERPGPHQHLTFVRDAAGTVRWVRLGLVAAPRA